MKIQAPIITFFPFVELFYSIFIAIPICGNVSFCSVRHYFTPFIS
ncbi:putative membrane protein [Bacteroides fragilis str. S24L15]|nr:putative membrane protein [Bacteroides fragilis str. S24L15]EYA76912.1 putative membrane protein [Bacteroides fragilis str. S24L26]